MVQDPSHRGDITSFQITLHYDKQVASTGQMLRVWKTHSHRAHAQAAPGIISAYSHWPGIEYLSMQHKLSCVPGRDL